MTIKNFIFLLYILPSLALSQNLVQKHIEEGISYHDAGMYEEAIDAYQHALYLDSTSYLAHYEIALTYYATGDLKSAIKHAQDVLGTENSIHNMAYMIVGNCLDDMGKTDEAIDTYQQAIKKLGGSNLLHYNLALSLYKQDRIAESETELIKAIQYNISHASSHLLMGKVLNSQKRKSESLLSLYYFLFLEPNSTRSTEAYDLLRSQMQGNNVEEKNGDFTIYIDPNALDNKKNPFGTSDFMLSMLWALNKSAKEEGKSEIEIFRSNTSTFLNTLGESKKKKNKGLWWEFYVPFLYDISQSAHLETFSYYISQSADPAYVQWINEHDQQLNDFDAWLKSL